MQLIDIAKSFKLANEHILSVDRYGEGHINETYLLVTEDNHEYILQKINNHIFQDVDKLMSNINLVLSFLRETNSFDDITCEVMNIIPTKDNRLYFWDQENDSYYRVYDFVKDSLTLQNINDASVFKESAIGFGKFAMQLKDFDASKLYEVLPNFHNTKVRFDHFMKTLSLDNLKRAETCLTEIEFVKQREKYVSTIIDKISDGSIPLRVTHNDTKLNNILFDEKTKKSLCVIDLDTIMPGSLLYDFGDSIRYGCNTASESEKDLSLVNFNVEYFKAYLEGYLSQTKAIMTKDEIENLAFSPILMTFECGMRFLDDYLDGDHYFRTDYQEHNLIRARTQFKLVLEMEKKYEEMKGIVKSMI